MQRDCQVFCHGHVATALDFVNRLMNKCCEFVSLMGCTKYLDAMCIAATTLNACVYKYVHLMLTSMLEKRYR